MQIKKSRKSFRDFFDFILFYFCIINPRVQHTMVARVVHFAAVHTYEPMRLSKLVGFLLILTNSCSSLLFCGLVLSINFQVVPLLKDIDPSRSVSVEQQEKVIVSPQVPQVALVVI